MCVCVYFISGLMSVYATEIKKINNRQVIIMFDRGPVVELTSLKLISKIKLKKLQQITYIIK